MASSGGPHNQEAERELVALSIVDRDNLITALESVSSDDIRDPHAREIYSAIQTLFIHDVSVTPLTVEDYFGNNGGIKKAGGAEFVKSLFSYPIEHNLETLITIIERDAIRRRAIEAGLKLQGLGWNAETTEEIETFANAAALNLSRNGGGGPQTVSSASAKLYDQVQDWIQNPIAPGEVRGLATHIPSLDFILAGVQPGEVIIFTARPSVGKSALVGEVAFRVGNNGSRVLFYALEMTKRQIVGRWASRDAGVETDRIRRGRCPDGNNENWYATDEEIAAYSENLARFTEMESIYIDDTPSLTMPQIRARTSKIARRLGGLDLIIIDTGNLVRGNNDGRNSAKVEGEKTEFAKRLAKENECPVFMVWQLNRAPDMRPEHRPMMPDLRDSGETEQNADGVIGLYREAYYAQTREQIAELTRNGRLYSLELLALKQREGSRLMRRVIRYEPHLHRFSEVATDEEPPGYE